MLFSGAIGRGVPLPDLHREFERVCGGADVVRRQWRKDWLQALGGVVGTARGESQVQRALRPSWSWRLGRRRWTWMG